jgi:DNA-binding NarL/FixJ family response regulator
MARLEHTQTCKSNLLLREDLDHKICVLIVDDHPVVCQGLAAALTNEPDLEVVGCASTAAEALRAAERLRPHVTVLDLELPDMSGAAVISELGRISPGTRVLAFSGHAATEYVRGAAKAGATGYLLKGAGVDEIAGAIRAVHSNEVYFDARITTLRLAEPRESATTRDSLTERELAVLRLVADGAPNKQIARSLGITERTAKFHLVAICKKLGAANRAHAATIAMRANLLPDHL